MTKTAEKLACSALAVVDSQDGFPIASLQILRAGHTDPDKYRCPSAEELPSPECTEWSVVSGGGGGHVVHWAILGLSGRDEGQAEQEKVGTVSFCKTGEYKVSAFLMVKFCFKLWITAVIL